jgi:general secretion pathway protein K
LSRRSPYPLPEMIRCRRASILVLALWSICLLSTFAVIISYNTRIKAVLIQRLDERDKLSLMAEAGAMKAITVLLKQEDKGYDTLWDDWSNNPGVFKETPLGEGRVSISYNFFDTASGLSETRYGMIDEERKINVNRMTLPVLKRLFTAVLDYDDVDAQDLAASIIDWRDADSELSIPLGSAEDSFYRGMRYPYESKDSDFQILDELLLVKGMTQCLLERVKDYITIYGSGKVNINTASGEVLLALGINEAMVHKILSYRDGEDKKSGTADDNIFRSVSDIVPKLSQRFNLSSSEVAHISAVCDLNLTTASENFMIKSRASLEGRRAVVDTVCVVTRTGEVLFWQESL